MPDYTDENPAPWYADRAYIREVVLERGVPNLGGNALKDCENLKRVSLPISLISIGDQAFMNCVLVRSITIPESVSSLGSGVFENCAALRTITLGERIPMITDRMFADCVKLTDLTLPEGVTSIGDSAFAGCTALTGLVVPENVTSIGDSAFSGCTALGALTLNGDMPTVAENAFTGVTAVIEYPETKTGYTDESMLDYGGSLTWKGTGIYSGDCGEHVRWTLLQNGTLVIRGSGQMADYGFWEEWTENGNVYRNSTPWFEHAQEITALVVEDGVTGIGYGAFAGLTGLTDVTLPDSVTEIRGQAFMHCDSLTELTLPIGLKTLDNQALAYCGGLTEILLPNGLTTLGEQALAYCSGLTDITLPDSLRVTGSYLFDYDSNLTTVTLPQTLKRVSYGMFRGCYALTELEIPATVETIEGYAFGECYGLQTVTLNGNMPSIYEDAFSGLSVTVRYSPDQEGYTAETMLDYGGSLTWQAIGYTVSYDANGGTGAPEAQTAGLSTDLVLAETVPTREGFFFVGWAADAETTETAYLPGASFTAREDTTLYAVWATPDFVLPAALKSIEEMAFMNGSFRFVDASNMTEAIEAQAFADCPNLRYIALPASCEIEENAFEHVEGLTILAPAGGSVKTFADAAGIPFVPLG